MTERLKYGWTPEKIGLPGAVGVAAHGIGTARASQVKPIAGAYAASRWR